MLKCAILNIVLIAIALAGVASCSRDVRSLDERMVEALNDRLQQYDVKGASAAVILPDGSIHRIVAGFSHDTVAMKPHMLFAVGSITKNMVATVVLQLAEEGLLSLEDSLKKWLPAYPKVDTGITIRQLLGHTSGIFMFWENQKIWDDLIKYRDSVFTPEVVLTYLKDPHFAPGKGFRYSNTNYLLLAKIITKATGSSLSAQLRSRFWQPLGLTNTYLSIEEDIPRDRLAHVWGDNFEKGGSIRDLTYLPRASHESITYGSAGVFATAEDLAVWCTSLFGGKILKTTSLEQMLDFNPAAAGSWCEGYGLGVFLFKKNITDGERAYGHGGGNIGTSAYMAYLPDYGVSIVVVINSMHGKCPDRMLEDIIEIVTQHLQTEKRQRHEVVRRRTAASTSLSRFLRLGQFLSATPAIEIAHRLAHSCQRRKSIVPAVRGCSTLAETSPRGAGARTYEFGHHHNHSFHSLIKIRNHRCSNEALSTDGYAM